MALLLQIISPELQNTQEPIESTLSVFDLMTSSGIGGQLIMLSLLVLSIIAVYIFSERLGAINRAAKEDVNFMNQIRDFIKDAKLEAGLTLCRNTNTPVARMLEKGISRIGRPLNDIAAAIENTGKLEVYKLERNLATLATAAGAAPMIGFLGTVIGMILAFHKMANAGGQINVEMLSQGIYTAMATTVAGLIVGIVAYIGYNMLVSRVEKVIYKMEARSTEFLDLLHTPVK